MDVHITDPSLTSLYIHWPFCIAKCPYCSFNSYGITEAICISEWKEAYFLVLHHFAKLQPEKTIRTIYFGGGTPSLMPASFVSELLKEIKNLWPLSSNIEISMEMNPGTINEKKLQDLAECGINRASVGVQSLSAEGLLQLGRQHTVEMSYNAVEQCLKLFPNLSIDMIYARPGHSVDIWKDELEQALSLHPHHLSLYQLTIEDNSLFGRMHRRGELLLPDDETCADLFEITQSLTEKAGYEAYEISNHALPGYQCVHNLRYWLYQDYIGIGPGAHSRISFCDYDKYALVEESNPKRWLKTILNEKTIPEEKVRLTKLEQAREALLVGLRTKNGLDVSTLPIPLEQAVKMNVLQDIISAGYLDFDQNILKGTAAGRQRLDAVILKLMDI